MKPDAYLLLLTSTAQLTIADILLIESATGFGLPLYGSSTDTVCQTLRIVRRPKNDPDSIQQKLSAIPTLQSVTIVPIGIPIEASQVTLIRNLFTQLNWNASSVTDQEIANYFTSEIQGSKTQYIHFDQHGSDTKKIAFKPLKDLAEYSPDWEERQQKFNEAINSGSFDHIDPSKVSFFTAEINETVVKEGEKNNIPPPHKNE